MIKQDTHIQRGCIVRLFGSSLSDELLRGEGDEIEETYGCESFFAKLLSTGSKLKEA